MNNILVNNLSKSFGKTKALDDVSFSVEGNELYGFIGADGAGKTTLFRILNTLLLADSGEVSVAGLNPNADYKKLRKILGYMPGRFSLYQDLSVEENLKFFASIFGTTIEENYNLIKDIYSHIEPFKKRLAGQLSGGMKQKLALSCALIHKPKVLILDEPTTGVDAVSRKEFWQMLKKLKEKGITILVSTPYMDEASLCDRVALMQNGKILSVNTPEKIIQEFGNSLFSVKSDNMYQLIKDLRNYPNCESVHLFGQSVHLTLKDELMLNEVESYLNSIQHTGIEIRTTQPTIEDCFIKLMVQQ